MSRSATERESRWSSSRLHWDDAAQTLVLGEGQGCHSGVPERVRIRLVVVTEAHGVGEEPTAVVDGEAVYEGRELRIAARCNEWLGVSS